MQRIDPAEVQQQLLQFKGQRPYLHLETTNGAYAAEGLQGQKAMAVGVYVRNGQIDVQDVQIAGSGPYRIGLAMPGGWLYAEGLTHWRAEAGRIELAGRDAQDRIAVAFQLSLTPFRFETEERVLPVPGVTPLPAPAGVPPHGPVGPPDPPAGSGTAVVSSVGPERHVLVILPHPDDETLACGGTIVLHTRAGNPVTYACATLGEMGRNMGNPALATRETLYALRQQELLSALRELGVQELRLLGIWDKTVEFQDPAALAARVRRVIEDVNPSLVLAYHPQYSVHPDHMALGAAVVAAVHSMPPERRPRLHVRAFGRNVAELGDPDIVVDVRAVMDAKLAAARAHRSQTEFMLKQWETSVAGDEAARKEAEERWAEEKYWIM